MDTVGFRDGLWADFYGGRLTDQARMAERLRRPRFGALEIEVTINDPEAYARPWIVTVNQHVGAGPGTARIRLSRKREGRSAARRQVAPRGRVVVSGFTRTACQRGRRRSCPPGIGSCTRRRSGFTRSVNTDGSGGLSCAVSAMTSTADRWSFRISPELEVDLPMFLALRETRSSEPAAGMLPARANGAFSTTNLPEENKSDERTKIYDLRGSEAIGKNP